MKRIIGCGKNSDVHTSAENTTLTGAVNETVQPVNEVPISDFMWLDNRYSDGVPLSQFVPKLAVRGD